MCIPIQDSVGIYMIASCPLIWENVTLALLCQQGLRYSTRQSNDELSVIPVSSLRSGVTYQNYYCAQCHEDTTKLAFWHLSVGSTTGSLRQAKTTWQGLYYSDKTQRWKTSGGALHLSVPYVNLTALTLRRCVATVDDCAPGWKNDTVRNLCQRYISVVQGVKGRMYRNYHCALCNGESLKSLRCAVARSNGQPEVARTGKMATDDYCLTAKRCKGGVCLQTNCVLPTCAVATSGNGSAVANVTRKGSHCPVHFQEVRSDYWLCENGSIWVAECRCYFTVGDYHLVQDEDDNRMLLCTRVHEGHTALAYVTAVCLCISLMSIAVHFVAVAMVPILRNLPGNMLSSLCASLAGTYIALIIAEFRHKVELDDACGAAAIIMYYCSLVSFFWMNCMAFDIWWTLHKANSVLRVQSGKQWRKFTMYSAYAWCVPALVVSASVGIEHATHDTYDDFRPRFGMRMCSFGNHLALFIFYIVPVIIVTFINVALFVMSARIVVRSSRKQVSGMQKASRIRRNWSLCLRMSLIMGLTWTMGIIVRQADIQPLRFPLAILNALQGFFLFICFTCSKKVYRRALRRTFPASKQMSCTQPTSSSFIQSSSF